MENISLLAKLSREYQKSISAHTINAQQEFLQQVGLIVEGKGFQEPSSLIGNLEKDLSERLRTLANEFAPIVQQRMEGAP